MMEFLMVAGVVGGYAVALGVMLVGAVAFADSKAGQRVMEILFD